MFLPPKVLHSSSSLFLPSPLSSISLCPYFLLLHPFLRFFLLPPSLPPISFPSFLLHSLLFFLVLLPCFPFSFIHFSSFPSSIPSAFSFILLHFPSYNQAFSFIRRSRITVRENWYLERILFCLPIMHCSPPFRHYYIRRTKLHIMFYCQRR